MENASKALIIAGAILISILLIAVAMYIYNAAKQPLLSAAEQMSSQDVQSYNSNYTPFLGDNVKGSTVRALIDTAINVNNSHAGEIGIYTTLSFDENTSISGTFGPSEGKTENSTGNVNEWSAALQGNRSKINTGHRYTVKATYGDTGLITTITIKDNNA